MGPQEKETFQAEQESRWQESREEQIARQLDEFVVGDGSWDDFEKALRDEDR